MSRGGGNSINSVFYAERYHPIQAGSIDGTDTLPHDRGVHRALLCSNAALYDPFGDPKVIGDPYCTLFVGRLSHLTTEDTLLKAMRGYGRVKNLRLVRHIVTGASRGYAFVEFETEKEMRRAYKDAHHTFVDDSEIIVDYDRQHLMLGWIPRRLGGGLGGKKESGQLRFGGRERPFRAPLLDVLDLAGSVGFMIVWNRCLVIWEFVASMKLISSKYKLPIYFLLREQETYST
ncbi:hypothetical protein ACS0TY_002174 [Phlomoides rotata]